MPFAIVIPPGATKPIVLARSDDERLLAALRTLFRSATRAQGGATDLPDTEAARRWLASQPEPCGWYETFDEVAAQLNRLEAEYNDDTPPPRWIDGLDQGGQEG